MMIAIPIWDITVTWGTKVKHSFEIINDKIDFSLVNFRFRFSKLVSPKIIQCSSMKEESTTLRAEVGHYLDFVLFVCFWFRISSLHVWALPRLSGMFDRKDRQLERQSIVTDPNTVAKQSSRPLQDSYYYFKSCL